MRYAASDDGANLNKFKMRRMEENARVTKLSHAMSACNDTFVFACR